MNRPCNGKAHSQSIRFCSEEMLKNAILRAFGNAHSEIANQQFGSIMSVRFGGDLNSSRLSRYRVALTSIALITQIDDDLLKFH